MKIIAGYFTKLGPIYEEEQEFESVEKASIRMAEMIQSKSDRTESIIFKSLDGPGVGVPVGSIEYFVVWEAEDFYRAQNQAQQRSMGQ